MLDIFNNIKVINNFFINLPESLILKTNCWELLSPPPIIKYFPFRLISILDEYC
jgi:hypothetical protein